MSPIDHRIQRTKILSDSIYFRTIWQRQVSQFPTDSQHDSLPTPIRSAAIATVSAQHAQLPLHWCDDTQLKHLAIGSVCFLT